MESRIHGDMYVRFGGRLVETYHRKVEKRCWPSLLKEVSVLCRISKRLTTQMARNTFAATVTLANRIPKEHVGEMLGYSSDYMLRHYTQALERNSQKA